MFRKPHYTVIICLSAVLVTSVPATAGTGGVNAQILSPRTDVGSIIPGCHESCPSRPVQKETRSQRTINDRQVQQI